MSIYYKMYLTGSIIWAIQSNLKRRILQHNTNKSFSTKNRGVWKIVYYESYRRKEDAVVREKRLKNYGQALSRLKERLKYSLL